jgi:GH24 family phage-related lysozyme (muramidase)
MSLYIENMHIINNNKKIYLQLLYFYIILKLVVFIVCMKIVILLIILLFIGDAKRNNVKAANVLPRQDIIAIYDALSKIPQISAKERRVLMQSTIFLLSKEGYRGKIYRCSANKGTIGIGDTNIVKEYPNIIYMPKYTAINFAIQEQRKIYKLLSEDVIVYPIGRSFDMISMTDVLNEKQMSALISLVYNIGKSAFIKKSQVNKLIARYVRGEFSDCHYFAKKITQAFIMWSKQDKKLNKGLLARRISEAKLFTHGLCVPYSSELMLAQGNNNVKIYSFI